MDRSRWHPEMLRTQDLLDEAWRREPAPTLQPPFDPQRLVVERVGLRFARGGPAMADTAERWVLAGGRRVLCRVHRPATEPSLPSIVFLHGGGWVWASIDTHDRLAREYAAASGAAVVLVDYALSPEARFPRAIEEASAVIRAVASDGASWGLDPARIAIAGDSAGGNLALGAALLLRETDGPPLRAIMLDYPVVAPAFDTESYMAFGEGHGLTAAAMRFFWNAYLAHEADRMNPLANLARAELAGLPPVRIHLAELDVLRSEGEALASRLGSAGLLGGLQVVPGVLHGFARFTETIKPARDSVAAGGAWLRERFATA